MESESKVRKYLAIFALGLPHVSHIIGKIHFVQIYEVQKMLHA